MQPKAAHSDTHRFRFGFFRPLAALDECQRRINVFTRQPSLLEVRAGAVRAAVKIY